MLISLSKLSQCGISRGISYQNTKSRFLCPFRTMTTEKTNKAHELGDNMKAYEKDVLLSSEKPWIMRLDGHKFSKFTSKFNRPFDDRIHNAMVKTCIQLLTTFNPSTVFTCSDEITLIFPSVNEINDDKNEKRVLMFSGRVQKIASLAAGLASVTFDRSIREECQDDKTILDHLEKSIPYFDARVHNVESEKVALENVIWRSDHDFRRNSVSMCAFEHFSKKELFKVSTKEMINKLKEIGFMWDDLPPRFKYGTFIKRENYEKEVEIKGELIKAVRTRPVELSFRINKLSDENINFLMSKTLPYEYNIYKR